MEKLGLRATFQQLHQALVSHLSRQFKAVLPSLSATPKVRASVT